MAKREPSIRVPRLRFPEFRANPGWETAALGSICEMRAGSFVAASDIADAPDLELFPCYGGNGLRGYTRSYTHTGKYSLIGRQGALCGNVKLVDGRFHATEHALVAMPRGSVASDWLYYALEQLKLNRYATGQAQPGLSVQVLERVSVAVPVDPAEQQKIADCLTSLDGVIAAQAQKVEALKAHKRGLIQQLFARAGETIPRLRFRGSETASSWRLTRLSNILSEPKRKSDGIARVHSVSVHKGLIDQIEHLGRSFAAADTSKYSLVRPFDVVYTKSPTGDFPYGIVKQSRLDHDAIVSPLYGVFTPVNQHVGRIIEAYFDAPQRAATYLAPIITKGAKNTIQISNTRFLSKGIPLPDGEEEQRQVADCLASADASIAAAAGKRDALGAHKAGLMQQLFPSPDEG